MAGELSEAEKIRLKRLAKLQNAPASNDNASLSSPKAATASTTSPSPDTRNLSSISPHTHSKPSADAELAPSTLQKRAKPSPSSSLSAQQPSSTSLSSPSSSSPVPSNKPSTTTKSTTASASSTPTPSAALESFDDWQARIVGQIFNITLLPEEAEKSSWQITYLKEAAIELTSENPGSTQPPRLSADIADRVLISRLSLSPDNLTDDDPELATVIASLPANLSTFEYLLTSWKRLLLERSSLFMKKGVNKDVLDKRLNVLDDIKNLIISYAGLTLQDPSMFPQPSNKPVGSPEIKTLILEPSSHPILTEVQATAFLTDISKRFANDGLEDVLGPAVKSIAADVLVKRININDMAWRQSVAAFRDLAESKPLAAMLTDIDNWDVDVPAPLIEHQILLGPLVRLSCFADAFPDVGKSWFPNANALTHQDTKGIWNTLQSTLTTYQSMLFHMFNGIIRAGLGPREKVLSLWGHVANANAKRAAMQVDSKTVSSDGFISNLQAVILEFAMPFLDANYSKINKVDPNFYKLSTRLDVSADTKIKATQEESDSYYNARGDQITSTSATPPNFITEIFFLCISYLHIGTMRLIRSHDSKARHLQRMKDELERVTKNNPHAGTPHEAIFRENIERFKKEIDRVHADIFSMETVLFDPKFLGKQVAFTNFVMVWLIRLLDPNKAHPTTTVHLPLPEESPVEFSMLPEFILEDLAEFYLFLGKYAPKALDAQPIDQLLVFMLVILSTPYIRNPYMKGQFVEIIFFLTRPSPYNDGNGLGDALLTHPMALKFLMPALIQNFIEIENTGSHTQFYDKFNTRYYISQIFQTVWGNVDHREALVEMSRTSGEFVRFVNYLMNDTTFLLDEVLSRLAKISRIQNEQNNSNVWSSFTDQEREDRESEYQQSENSVKSYNIFATEALKLFVSFTSTTPGRFVVPEIVDRLSAMLDYNLDVLAGPKCQDLKVADPAKYGFKARDLLSNLMQIFMNLSGMEEFVSAIARDGRSYRKELFVKACGIASRAGIKTEVELDVMRKLIDNVEEARAIMDDEDEDVPDEYLDPLTYILMKDPVRLPTSRTVVDRSSIVQHLLSEENDPFNRMPLKIEDVIPETELKAQIEEYISKQKASRMNRADNDVKADDVDAVMKED